MVILTILILFLTWDCIYNPLKRYYQGIKLYNKARKIALEKNKKLLLLGDPCFSIDVLNKIIYKHFHGDITVDLYGCDKCQQIEINFPDINNNFGNQKYVVYDNSYLQYSYDLNGDIKKIKEISEGDFISLGSLNSIMWRLLLYKIYNKYSYKKINYFIKTFDYSKNSYFYFYNLKNNKHIFNNFS